MAKRLNELAASNKLLKLSDTSRLLWAWGALTSYTDVKNWLGGKLADRDSVIRLAEILPATGYNSSLPGDGSFVSLDAKGLKTLVDIDALDARLKVIQRTKMSKKNRNILDRYFKADRKQSD